MARALCIKAKNMRYFLNIRDGRPAVGEEGDPVVVFRLGRTGDFD